MSHNFVRVPIFPWREISSGPICQCGRRDKCPGPGKHIARKWAAAEKSMDIPEGYGTAVLTGQRSGIWGLDLDIKEGKNSLDFLEAVGPIPATYTVRTPTGGYHYYFALPNDQSEVKTTAGVIWPGVDIRGEGGVLFAPPSVRPDGPYEVINDVDPAIAPAHLQALVEMQPAFGALASKRQSTEGDRNTQLYKFLCGFANDLGDDDLGHKTLALAALCYNANYAEPPLDDLGAVMATADQAAKWLGKSSYYLDITEPLHTLTRQIMERLGEHPNIYSKAGVICEQIGYKMVALNTDTMSILISDPSRFSWITRNDKGVIKPISNPPERVVKACLRRSDHSLLKKVVLESQESLLINTEDGGVDLASVGYNKSAEIYVYGDSIEYEWMDVPSAVEVIKDALIDFPLEYDGEAGWAAVAMSLMAQPMLEGHSIPLYYFTAPMPGSGKSKLAATAIMVGTGARKEPSVTFFPSRDDEMTKALIGYRLAGKRALFFDNFVGELKSVVLAELISGSGFVGRLLGGNQAVELGSDFVFVVTGNRAVLGEDFVRRSVTINLMPDVEDPTARTGFRHMDPHFQGWVANNLGRLRSAIMAILAGYKQAGMPRQTEPLASFERWNHLVRDSIIWSGLGDPLKYQKENAHELVEDTEATLLEVLDALEPLLPSRAADLYAGLAGDTPNMSSDWARLRKLMQGRTNEMRNLLSFGQWLSKYMNKRKGGRWIRKRRDRQGMLYEVVRSE